LQIECGRLTQTAVQLQNEIDIISAKKNMMLSEVDFLENNKNRLINDIRIASLVIEKNPSIIPERIPKKSLPTFEVQTYQKKEQPFDDLSAFIMSYKRLFEDGDSGPSDGKKALFQLRDKRLVLCANPRLVQLIAKYSNNCNLFIQQVEADWLKYDSFYVNGLEQCWQSAHANPEVIHFLLLEDINMSAIECYARPMTDLVAGIRTTLPGFQTPWPNNLWVFGVPVETDKENGFGVPLLEHSFRYWGALPIFSKINSNLASDKRYLPVQALINHDIEFSVSLNEYFS